MVLACDRVFNVVCSEQIDNVDDDLDDNYKE